MRVAVVYLQKFLDHSLLKHFILHELEALNNTYQPHDDLFITEDLTVATIEYINENYDAIYTRHGGIKNALLDLVTIPVFTQVEFPYHMKDEISSRYIYLTDISYLKHFPIAESQRLYYFDSVLQDDFNRKYDILFVGRYGKVPYRQFIKQELLDLVRQETNSILTSDEIHQFLLDNCSEEATKTIKKTSEGYKNMWYIIHFLRAYRRELIIKELYTTANKNYKVCVVTNEQAIQRFSKHRNIDFYIDLKFEQLNYIIRASKITIVSNPLHFSFVNERGFLAVRNNSIPICESYPQYEGFFKNTNPLYFDYVENKLSTIIPGLLNKSNDELKEISNVININVKTQLSKEKYRKKWRRLIEKYR